MHAPLLIIGNKNYSSWSLRGWLLLKQFNIEFEEQLIQLFDPSSKPILNQYSPTGKVPALVMNHAADSEKICVTDSLAIAIYANNYLTELDIWSGKNKSVPQFDDGYLQAQRAFCQSIVAEMHSSFMGMRSEMPMNIRVTAKIKPSNACLADLARIDDIFEQCLQSRDAHTTTGNYLFGTFSVADAFYAPVVLRLKTYAESSGITLGASTIEYMQTMLKNPNIQSWCAAALQETDIIDENEAGKIVTVIGVLR